MLYKFCWVLFNLIFKVWLRWDVYDVQNIPSHGPVVLASNHLSLMDPPVVGSAATRRVNFMAKAELFEPPIFGPIIRIMGAFPVKRGSADRQAMKYAINLLQDGQVVGVFPEGTRSKTGDLGKAGDGAFMMAAWTKADIVPVLVTGTDFKRHPGWPKVQVIFGKPLDYNKDGKPTKENLAHINELWVEAMHGLEKQYKKEPTVDTFHNN
jgi:1-acyl-sn-glycerol-3-phosphate acyltransferase